MIWAAVSGDIFARMSALFDSDILSKIETTRSRFPDIVSNTLAACAGSIFEYTVACFLTFSETWTS